MKHLKKLSVVLMLTALFSVTFTSCIDNEVSPLVEAIYEAQADLIAAQANVQNAEATRLESEAALNLALAAQANADATFTLEEVEELRIANALAQIEVDEAQAEFNVYLVQLLAELEEANAQIALDYALKYRMYANAATDLLDDKADAVYDLAYAQAQADSSYPLFAIQALETVVANAQYQVEVNEAKIAALQALIDDPNSMPAQVTAWEAELDELQIAIDAKESEIAIKEAERDNLIAGWDGEDDVRDNFVQLYDGYVTQSETLSGNIEVYQELVDDATAAIATYAADLTAAEGALTAAETAYDAAWLALGVEDAAGATPAFQAYFTIDADEDAIAAGGAKYAAPANLQEVYVNARIDYEDALDAFNTYQADFDALVSTYNAAAVALEAAQDAFDTADYAGDLATAEDDLTTVEGDYADALDAYTAARIAFEADPTGSVYTDGAELAVTDLGVLGIKTDIAPKTYMRVASWVETSLGSGEYIPATFAATKYNTADLLAYANSLIALDGTAYPGAVGGGLYNLDDETDVIIWEQDGTSVDLLGNPTGLPTNNTFLTLAEAQDALSVLGNVNVNSAYFLEVEIDDIEVPNLNTFNVATNKLGVNDFSDRAIIGNPAAVGYMPALTIADTDAGYDTSWDGDILIAQVDDALTLEAALWNAKLEVAYRTYLLSVGDDALVAAQEAFDYQQELFDNGVANLAELAGDLDVAEDAKDDAKEAVDHAWLMLGDEYAEGIAGNAKLTTSTAGAWYFVNFVSGTKALTTNAVVFNAEVTLADLEACDADCLQAIIDFNQHEIDLIQPALDGILAIIAEMQAQYDIYMETYIPGSSTSYDNLDADLKVLYNELTFEIFALNQELNNLDAQYDSIDDILGSLGNDDNLSDISLDIELAILYDSSQGSYLDSLNDLEDAEDALAAALAGSAEDAALIEYYQSVVDVLEQRYQNALALAAKYKALMEAALAS